MATLCGMLDFSPLIRDQKAMAPHSSTLAWKIPWMEEPGGLQSMGSLRVGHDWVTSLSLFHFHALEKEMTTQCSCLENPRDGGAWWAAVYGVTQSRTQLKWFSSSNQGSNPCLPQWKCRVLTSGPPGKSLFLTFFIPAPHNSLPRPGVTDSLVILMIYDWFGQSATNGRLSSDKCWCRVLCLKVLAEMSQRPPCLSSLVPLPSNYLSL